ncbi:hypothetical protein GLAREA_00877 [Glarea lozoyensis ATCC 20868]|uniref:Uncharacterized protein n=1 Tax=Glarea lozoyensis (strain ATCC 20868 / MF5171) TaxID=1116229 RepID=S3CTJ8_GLAL2|nr:uncharacterized protein GLAREA_00877 [Glarea lozoyensis ATCC 20868]EPE29717.1 hypothetical protein GLAREA_00877 [Glarea lozoyensis ATCC 20868]
MFNHLKLLITSTLIFSSSVLALPTAELTPRGTLHPCSVKVDRWYQNSFDTYYFSKPLLPSGDGDYSGNFFTQESDVTPVGGELVEHKVGSYVLYIYNLANAAEPGRIHDAGKLSFSWGNQTWDSFSPCSPCVITPVGTNPAAGAASVACNFQCDVFS